MMFAQLVAMVVAGAAAAAPAPAQDRPAAAPAAASTASEEELKRLRAELPKVLKSAEPLNAGEIASAQDYPQEAIVNDQQGSVEVWLLVGLDGRVQRCGIEQSSGSAALDTQTCDLFVAKAMFRPAVGKSGRIVASIYTQRMNWLLAGEAPATVKNEIAREILIVGPEGEVRSCKQEYRITNDRWVEGPKEGCAAWLDGKSPLLVAARAKSKLHDAELVMESRAFTEPAEPMPPVAQGAGDVLVYLQTATMRFAADGKRTNCTISEVVGPEGFRHDACTSAAFAKAPPKVVKAGIATGDVRFLWAIYLKGEPK